MRRAPNSEITRLLKEAERLGWHIHRRTKHYQLRHPDGFRLTVPCSPKSGSQTRKILQRNLRKFPYTTLHHRR